MRTALDTNILSALWSNEPHAEVIAQCLGRARQQGPLVLSPVAYVELFAYPGATEEFIHRYLQERQITVDFELDAVAWTEAGRRFSGYAQRRRKAAGGEARRVAADFVVGAHALLHAERLMTLDVGRFRRDFPELILFPVEPAAGSRFGS
jgi:predicted nucleic acid-binding protein